MTREGVAFSAIVGVVSDISHGVEVAKGIKKDLAYVTNIETPSGQPYVNSDPTSDSENEGWFAIPDLTVISDDVQLFSN